MRLPGSWLACMTNLSLGKRGQMKFSPTAPADRVLHGAGGVQAGDFIVKVQRPVGAGGSPDMLLYNRDRNVHMMISSAEPDYATLQREVANAAHGMAGLKIYLHAAIDSAARKLNVRLQPHAPMQDW